MKYSKLKRKLRKSGCGIKKQDKKHEWWYSPVSGKCFPVGRHDNQEVASGTLAEMRKESGIRL